MKPELLYSPTLVGPCVASQGSPSNLRPHPEDCRRKIRRWRRSEEHAVDLSVGIHLPPILRAGRAQPSPVVNRVEPARRQVSAHAHSHRQDAPRPRQLFLVRAKGTVDAPDELVRARQRRRLCRFHRACRHAGSCRRASSRVDLAPSIDVPRAIPTAPLSLAAREGRGPAASPPD